MGLPSVTIIVPIRNEARYIAECLNALLNLHYPMDRVEILVVDGMSEDGTRDIVAGYAGQHVNVKLIDNPSRIVPTALNLGIREAHGQVIIRVDGHAVVDENFLWRSIETLMRSKADCVGGPIETVGETWRARVIALAQSSPLGVGNAAFRYARDERAVDTLAFGTYRAELFAKIGMFDEELVRNQDDEFNFRLIRAGGRILLNPKIRSLYHSRASLRGLWKQYDEYGFWKVRVIQKHGRPASWRHLVPAAFVLALALLTVTSVVVPPHLWLLLALIPYGSVLCAASIWIGARKGWQYAPLLPAAFATMHLGYGTGFLMGLLRFVLLQRPAVPAFAHGSVATQRADLPGTPFLVSQSDSSRREPSLRDY